MRIEKALKILEEGRPGDVVNRKLKGMNLLSKYVSQLDIESGHDIIYVCDFNSTVEKMSEDEVKILAEYGFFNEEDSWAFFT